ADRAAIPTPAKPRATTSASIAPAPSGRPKTINRLTERVFLGRDIIEPLLLSIDPLRLPFETTTNPSTADVLQAFHLARDGLHAPYHPLIEIKRRAVGTVTCSQDHRLPRVSRRPIARNAQFRHCEVD